MQQNASLPTLTPIAIDDNEICWITTTLIWLSRGCAAPALHKLRHEARLLQRWDNAAEHTNFTQEKLRPSTKQIHANTCTANMNKKLKRGGRLPVVAVLAAVVVAPTVVVWRPLWLRWW